MIELIDIPTEQTTAATDLILAVLALSFIFYLRQVRDYEARRKEIWSWVFELIALVGVLGTVIHGFKIPEGTRYVFWQAVYLALGLVVSLFVVGVIYDLKGYVASWMIIVVLTVGICFFVVTLLVPDSFLIFIVYEALALLFAISAYTWLAIKRKLVGSWLIAIGLSISIIAAIIQTTETVQITFIWKFDHNGLFHIVQLVGLLFIMVGLNFSFKRPLV